MRHGAFLAMQALLRQLFEARKSANLHFPKSDQSSQVLVLFPLWRGRQTAGNTAGVPIPCDTGAVRCEHGGNTAATKPPTSEWLPLL